MEVCMDPASIKWQIATIGHRLYGNGAAPTHAEYDRNRDPRQWPSAKRVYNIFTGKRVEEVTPALWADVLSEINLQQPGGTV